MGLFSNDSGAMSKDMASSGGSDDTGVEATGPRHREERSAKRGGEKNTTGFGLFNRGKTSADQRARHMAALDGEGEGLTENGGFW